MFSNSNAYLGGNSQRPGAPQYGQPLNSMNPGQQQQPGPFAPQPTGFGQQGQQQAPLQQQFTGYPMQPQQTGMPQQTQSLQPQYTGYVAPNQQMQTGFQQSSTAPPMPSIPSQYQQQFQQQQQQQQQQQPFQQQVQQQPPAFSPSPQQSAGPTQPPAAMKPQPTGFSQMAASFQTGGGAKPEASKPGKTNKIPNIRLSFITAQDQTRFETLFKSAIGNDSTMSGDKARDLLLRSKLDGDTLSHIWFVGLYILLLKGSWLLILLQDSCRHDPSWAALLPRIRIGHVPMQLETVWKNFASCTT